MIQPIGYFKLWRELFTKPIWLNSTPEQKTIFVTLLAMANFSEKEWEWKGEKFKADRGEFVTSLDSIARNCGKGITIQNVRTALKRFENLGFITNESTKTGRLITIVNWEVYQSTEDEPNKEDNKDLTKSQQRPNKDLTPREERKNDKNDKNDIYSGRKDVFDYYLSLNLIKHKKYTPAMDLAIKTAMKNNGYTIEDCKVLLDRHKKAVEKTKNSEYPIRARPLHEFFGQKAYQAKHLICAEYEEGGKYYNVTPKREEPQPSYFKPLEYTYED